MKPTQKSLRPHVTRWVQEDLITQDQANSILAKYPADSRSPATMTFSIIGGLLCIISLRYEISTLPERFHELDDNNQEVYITLQPSGSVWEIQDVGKVPPVAGMPYLKGQGNGREIKY